MEGIDEDRLSRSGFEISVERDIARGTSRLVFEVAEQLLDLPYRPMAEQWIDQRTAEIKERFMEFWEKHPRCP